MRDECNHCMNWEEKIYWSHFQSVQFFQILPQNYQDQLAIPKKFLKNLVDKLGKVVVLKVPSGATWNVGIISGGDFSFLKLGWKEFIEENFLKQNDILMFKFVGNSRFDVFLFDGQNLCEKEASYFVRKCGHPEMSKGCKRKETVCKCLNEHVREPEPEPEPEPELSLSDDSVQKVSSDVHSISCDDSTEWTPGKRLKTVGTAPEKPVMQRPQGRVKKRGRKKGSTSVTRAGNKQKQQFVSNRRPVTEEEKKTAERLAYEAASSDDSSLVLVMQSYHVYRNFHLTIPSWWHKDRFPRNNTTITLQVNGKIWKVKFWSRIAGGQLTTGWQKFVLENLLEEYDVCVFKLAATSKSNEIVMDVSIFRVVEDATPVTPTRPVSRERGPYKGYLRTATYPSPRSRGRPHKLAVSCLHDQVI